MKIYISEEDVIANIRNRFTTLYPYLSIECFREPHRAGEGSPFCDRIADSTPIDDIRMMHAFGWIDLDGRRSVAEIEKEFYELFGLSVQVFRRGDNCMLQTTRTDFLSLYEQNELGKRGACTQAVDLPEAPSR